jgi:hypothetical protein
MGINRRNKCVDPMPHRCGNGGETGAVVPIDQATEVIFAVRQLVRWPFWDGAASVRMVRGRPARQVPHDLLDRAVNGLQPRHEAAALRLRHATQVMARRELGMTPNRRQVGLDHMLQGGG